jgi:PleD family two-component response regulator
LKRTLNENKNWSAMLVKMNDFDAYREIYGELAADKLLQTFTAIINSALDEKDFFGELLNCEFLIITNSLKAELIASFTVQMFDAIIGKFYTENDAKQGYIVLYGDDNAGKRIPPVSTSIGVISSEYKTYADIKSAIGSLIAVHKLAKYKPGSSYVTERPKISAVDAIKEVEHNRRVMIIETDDALNLLLKTTGEMQGYEVKSVNDFSLALKAIEDYKPGLIILDAGSAQEMKGLEISRKLKADERFKNIKIILSTIIHDKKLVLDTGADLYLPKPYELVNMFNWVEALLRESSI